MQTKNINYLLQELYSMKNKITGEYPHPR